MSNYILLKDIPDARAGTVFECNILSCGNKSYIYKTRHNYHSEASIDYVENNPEWFRKKEEEEDGKIEIPGIDNIVEGFVRYMKKRMAE